MERQYSFPFPRAAGKIFTYNEFVTVARKGDEDPALSIEGAFEITPVQHGDARGLFLEWYRAGPATRPRSGIRCAGPGQHVGLRGPGSCAAIHFADVPPGQAKYVTCTRGAVLDVIVDIRVGSPTFGRWEGVRLDDVDRRAVYIGEGWGTGSAR